MTKQFELEVLESDVGLIDQPNGATINLSSRVGADGVRVSVLETTEEGLVAKWAHILDGHDKPYVARVLDGDNLISERCGGEPDWRQA